MHDRRYWFRRTGWLHWVPISWEGWLATAVFVGLAWVGLKLTAHESLPLWLALAWTAVCIIALIFLVVKTTDPQA